MNQPSNKIIQVGWTIADPVSGRSYEIKGSYIRLDEPLDPRISNLCGISQETLDKGDSLGDAYVDILFDYIKYDVSKTVITWGKGDLALLKNQLGSPENWPFGQHYIDAKNLYQSWKLKIGASTIKGGLARAMTKFPGLKFEGRKHSAVDDSYNTFRLYSRLLKEFK